MAQALILIDYQRALCEVGEHTRLPALAESAQARDVVARASNALEHARRIGLYVVHVKLGFDASYEARANHTPRWKSYPESRAMLVDSPEAQIVPALTPLSSEPVVVKTCVNPFIATPLTEMLTARGIHNIVLAGVATNMAVESALRHAGDSGYQVSVLEDACASFSDVAHSFSVETIMPMFGTVTTTIDFIGT